MAKRKLKVLALLDAMSPTSLDHDLQTYLKVEERKTEADVLEALQQLGHTTEHLAIYDDLDLLRQKLQTFQPDVIFNLADQFKNNRAFDQNIAGFLAMYGIPFTGCGSTGLTLCKHKGISKKILGYHRIHVPAFVMIPRGKRIGRPRELNFPILVKPLKEEDAYPAMPEDGYGWEKLFSERMCRHFTEDFGLQTRVARYHNVYGPLGTYNGGREKAPAAICRKVIAAKLGHTHEIEIWGDGEQTRSFMYIDDCLLGTGAIMASDVIEPLNLGSDELVSINQLVDIVEELLVPMTLRDEEKVKAFLDAHTLAP